MEEFVMRKKRSYGEILNATFSFVRLHARMIALGLLQLVMPFLVVICGALIVVFYYLSSSFTGSPNGTESHIGIVVLTFLLVCFLSAVALALANSVYYAVVKLAVQFGTQYTIAQLRAVVRSIFWSMVGLYIFQIIIVMLASYALVIPLTIVAALLGGGIVGGIVSMLGSFLSMAAQFAISVFISLSFATLVIERSSVYNSVMRSIKLIRGSLWKTFSLQMSTGIIVYCMMAAPLVYPALIGGILYKLLDPLALSRFVTGSPLVLAISGSVYALFTLTALLFIWVLFAVSQSLMYMNLVERREGVGLALRLNRTLEPAPEAELATNNFKEEGYPRPLEEMLQQSSTSIEESVPHTENQPSSESQEDHHHPEAASQPSDSSTTEEGV